MMREPLPGEEPEIVRALVAPSESGFYWRTLERWIDDAQERVGRVLGVETMKPREWVLVALVGFYLGAGIGAAYGIFAFAALSVVPIAYGFALWVLRSRGKTASENESDAL